MSKGKILQGKEEECLFDISYFSRHTSLSHEKPFMESTNLGDKRALIVGQQIAWYQ